jgi:hypothetical protein
MMILGQRSFMKKMILVALALLALLCVGGYYAYKTMITDMIADAVTAGSLPDYIPKRIQSRIQGISAPINKGTEAMLKQMHTSDIPVEEILAVIDATTEEQIYALVEDLDRVRPRTTDEVFTIAKKHISSDFDVEVFRKHFNDHITMQQIRKALFYANQNRKTHDLDFAMAKTIVKKILLEKEEEYYTKQHK